MAVRIKKVKVTFSASGYGTKIKTYNSYEEAVDSVEDEAKEIAAEHDAEWEDCGDEYVVNSRDGEEIARWIIES